MTITKIVLRFQGKSKTSARDERWCRELAAVLNETPTIDAAAIRDELLSTLGYVPGRVVTLLECAAKYMNNRDAVDGAILANAARSRYEEKVARFRKCVAEADILKTVVSDVWLKSLDSSILEWDVRDHLSLPNHILFMAYLDDVLLYVDEPSFIDTIESGVAKLRTISNKTLNDKVKHLVGARDAFVPTAFELLILSRFVQANRLIEYEPEITTGVPEARIVLAGRQALVEARAKMEKKRASGPFDPKKMGHALYGKARDKYTKQLAGATEPVILFMSLDAYVVQDLEPEAMLSELLADSRSAVVSAIVFSDTYRAKNLSLWIHPRARHPLTRMMVADLRQVLGVKPFCSSGTYLPKRSLTAKICDGVVDGVCSLWMTIRRCLKQLWVSTLG